jgi:hypothetical protein
MAILGVTILVVTYLKYKHGETPALHRATVVLAVTSIPLVCLVVYNSWRLYTSNP